MDLTDRPHNDSDLMSDRPPETEADSPQIPAEQHASELVGAVERLDLSLSVMREVARRLAAVSEAREAKIRELQDAIKNETYHVTAEQIADKMLRRTLRDDLT
jgi:anti-sigma28 factor (negative regulator of flagellin synthesis)